MGEILWILGLSAAVAAGYLTGYCATDRRKRKEIEALRARNAEHESWREHLAQASDQVVRPRQPAETWGSDDSMVLDDRAGMAMTTAAAVTLLLAQEAEENDQKLRQEIAEELDREEDQAIRAELAAEEHVELEADDPELLVDEHGCEAVEIDEPDDSGYDSSETDDCSRLD